MKKILFFAAAMLCVTAANAKAWRINYEDNANADFKTIAAACSAAKVADTDTLYLEAGYYPEGNTISRAGMTVIGPGWGFAPNYGDASTIAEAQLTTSLSISADNVKVMGLVCKGTIDLGYKQVSRANCTIEKCKATDISWASVYAGTCENITIKNCYLTKNISLTGCGSTTWKSYVKNVNIIGNIINSSSYEHIYISDLDEQVSNINILNNTFIGKTSSTSSSIIKTKNSIIQDNIIINTANETFVMDFAQTGNIIRKNVFSLSSDNVTAYISEKYPDNYYVAATISNTFVNKTSAAYYDEAMKFQLLETTPAKGGAYDGGDCGAFGGTTPYVLNGRPQGIPYIYDVEVPAQPKENKLHVTFKVKGQNE